MTPSYGANVRAASGGRMTPVSLLLSTAGASQTLISSDRLGASPATQPGSCLVACHLGQRQSTRRGRQLDNSPTPTNSAKWHPRVHTQSDTIQYTSCNRGNHRKEEEEDRMRLFTGLTLMPCGLYIWLAARLSLYPPVWLITWRRVSTWNSGDTQTKGPVRQKALDNKDSHAQRKGQSDSERVP